MFSVDVNLNDKNSCCVEVILVNGWMIPYNFKMWYGTQTYVGITEIQMRTSTNSCRKGYN